MVTLIECLKKLKQKEADKNQTVGNIIENVEMREPESYVELHKLADNRYWVGYNRRGKEVLEELQKCLEGQ